MDMSMESTSQKTSSRSAVSKDMELQVCVCGWSKATTVRGLKIHQGRMKCLREKGQGPRIDQYFLRSQSSQSNEIQRQEANHSSQDISTPVIDVRRTCMDTVSDEPNDPCEPAVSHVLYGERLGLLQDHIDPDTQKFIDCITLMFKTTSPMLYIPPSLLRRVGAKVWRDHVEAWDTIFSHADRCIQNIYRKLRQSPESEGKYPGVLASLLMLDKLSIEDIKASVTELMAGGVDTTSITLLWTMYELARYPDLQEQLRAEVQDAWASSQGDMIKMLKSIPLVKGAIKETLRLHPVAVSLQRYITEDIVIQNYHIPSGTLVQIGLYAMGRNPQIFPRPLQYNPARWLKGEIHYFKSLSFGFGPRQCLGRRIAEIEMQLFLIHLLQNFKIEKQRQVDVGSTFELIILPDKPILLTLRPLH
ncbi:UNVERIFIED_CONTAM: hypothetical protein FKN15_008328 [Acipenser sinensis]